MNIQDSVKKWMDFANIGTTSMLARPRTHTKRDVPRTSTLNKSQRAMRKTRRRMARMSRRINRHQRCPVHGRSQRR